MENLSVSKKKLFEKCLKLVAEQIQSAENELKKLQEMEGEETKSSAGDKYETSRAMLHLEKEKVSIRLSEAHKKQRTLIQIKPEKTTQTAELGSLVRTDRGIFFLAVSLGKENLEKIDFFVISPVSPIGQALSGKKTGDTASFGTNVYQVLEVV